MTVCDAMPQKPSHLGMKSNPALANPCSVGDCMTYDAAEIHSLTFDLATLIHGGWRQA